MANLVVKDGSGATKYVAQTGAGSDVDPFVRLVVGPLTDTELREADVKVTLDGETVGIASFPTVTLTTVSNACASAGANTVVAAPAAGYHHVLYAFQLQMEAAATTLQRALLKSDTTEMWRFVGTVIGSGDVQVFQPGQELHWGSAKAIVIDLAEAKSVGYVLRYRTIAD